MKKILLFIAAISGSVMLSGCEDFLTTENRSNITDKQQFSTKEGFESLVADAYANLRTIYNDVDNYNRWFNAGTDMYTMGRGNKTDVFHEYLGLDADNGTVNTLYTECYDGIRAAYQVLHYAPAANITDELRNRRSDEARVIAAHYYYILVNTFGGVPLIKEFIQSPATGYPRVTAQETYDWIIGELESVVKNNYLEPSSKTGGRVSMEVAKAQLAQAYLSAAWDLNKTEYFAKAAAMADQVIAGHTLEPDFAKLWKADRSGDDNAEFIWDIEYDFTTAHNQNDGGHSWSTAFCAYLGGNEDPVKATNQVYVPSLRALHNFEKGDVRYDVTFMKELPSVAKGNKDKTSYYTWYENNESLVGHRVERYYSAWYETDADFEAWKALDPDNRKDTYRIPMDEQTKDPQTINGPAMDYKTSLEQVFGGGICKKFDDSETASKTGSDNWRDIHVITLPEMFFVAAEAYLKAGDSGKALARLNSVRNRAGLANATEITIDAILKERSCELFGLGKRWFDLRRTQKLVEYNEKYNDYVGSNASSWVKTLRPIPQGAIDANDQLSAEDQNPEYME